MVTAPVGKAAESENAPPVIFWQPRQWQAIVRIGGAVMVSVSAPHRQLAVIGSVHSPLAELVSGISWSLLVHAGGSGQELHTPRPDVA